ncbi:MAG: hypothetical protein GY924_24190 [Planctomycetaceae bacterium]|nr:hypothetical protein [Planctomycetaceae bacterium]
MVLQRAITAIACAFTIELSQLYHASWIDSLRQTTLGEQFWGSISQRWTSFAIRLAFCVVPCSYLC